VAVVHVAIVAALGGKLLVDRAIRPRVWARTVPVDPDLPIRGRYVRIWIVATAGEGAAVPSASRFPINLDVVDDRLIATPSPASTGLTATAIGPADERAVALDQPLAYFIPEHVPDPARRAPGEELWVEVTVPRRGPPRPIRLGVKKDGVVTPLEF
jgi:hypothetical protein